MVNVFMRILAIDTSTMFGSVALCEDGRLIAEEQLGVDVTHSERLTATIEHLFAVSGWPKDSIDGIAVAIGPGSFTGLRIGLATAKGLALGLKKPIAGVSSLRVLAHKGFLFPETVVPVIDAKRGEVYCSAYRFNGEKIKCVMKETVLDPKLLGLRLKKIRGKLLLVGDGVVTYEKLFKRMLGAKAVIPNFDLPFPHASHLAMIARDHLRRQGDDLVKLVPNYLRHSDAEIGFRGREAERLRS